MNQAILRPPREIHGLHWAFPRSTAPAFTQGRRPRGSKGAGLRYERAVARALPMAEHGRWFEFCDQFGLGWCSPDLILKGRGQVYVLEVKLSDTRMADAQLGGLYLPILAKVYGLPIRGVVITRHLSPETPLHRVVSTLKEALSRASEADFPILHWLGRGSLI